MDIDYAYWMLLILLKLLSAPVFYGVHKQKCVASSIHLRVDQDREGYDNWREACLPYLCRVLP